MSALSLRCMAVAARMAWSARRLWASLDGPMLLALAALCFCLGLAGFVNRPLRQEVRALHAASWALASKKPASPDAAVDRETAREAPDAVQAFLAFLPHADLWSQQLQTLHSLVGQGGVTLARADYGIHRFEHLPGSRLSVRMTMQAGTAAFRKFLHELLAAMPNLAIDRISTERSPDHPDRLDIRLEASLYYRDARLEEAR